MSRERPSGDQFGVNPHAASSTGSGTPLYALRGVVKRHGRGPTQVEALNIDLEITGGEFVVVAGASGSGKSTLLQLLGALDRPTAGTLEFEGDPLASRSDDELAGLRQRRIGFVFQIFNLIPTLTAAENVELALAPAGVSANGRRVRVGELLAHVGLAARAAHLPTQLSGGEQQRVAIARALANRPDVLLADEPTGNLDTTTGEQILALLDGLWRQGRTLILVTHDPAIAAMAPRVVRLRDGALVADERNASRTSLAEGVR
jgi:putative ABC transport system ATP-binding protein